MPLDMNDAAPQREFGALLPDGVFVKLVGTIKAGGATLANTPPGDPDIGIYKMSKTSDAMMLDWEFTVDGGEFNARKVFHNMVVAGGSVDENGRSKGGEISRSMLKAMLNSAMGLDPKDDSPAARGRRVVPAMKSFDGIPFYARIGIEGGGIRPEGGNYNDKNIIALVIEPGMPEYGDLVVGNPVEPKPAGIRRPAGSARAAAGHAPDAGNPSWMTNAAPAAAAQAPAAGPQPRWGSTAPAAVPQPGPTPQPVATEPAATGPTNAASPSEPPPAAPLTAPGWLQPGA